MSNGLYKKYGEMRLLDTPICENGFMGMGEGRRAPTTACGGVHAPGLGEQHGHRLRGKRLGQGGHPTPPHLIQHSL